MKQIKLLYIDLFCGAGGTSTGVETAKHKNQQCAKVIACVNHDANAIASHAANHPDALHFTEDIRTLELSPLIEHISTMRSLYPDAFIILWASLECTNFSKAKGGKPRDADSRTLAEHLFRYIEAINPDYIQIENVEEFMSWGDLDENGKPISKDAGRLYQRWITSVQKYGYYFKHRILNAADYGAYTSRKRFFGIFTRHNLPILFPESTHAKNPVKDLFVSTLRQWKPVREVLDFSNDGNSIFGRKKPLVEASLNRIYEGCIKFVAGGKEAFMIKYNSMNQKGKYVAPGVDEPCPTVATQSRIGVAFISKYFSGNPSSKNYSIHQPAGTITTIDHHSLISTEFLSAYYGNGHNHSINSPAPTLTTKDRFSYIKPCFIANSYSGWGQLNDINDPASAILTNPKQNLVTCSTWIMNPQYTSKGGSVNTPCFTLIARMDKQPPYLMTTTTKGKYPSFIKEVPGGLIYEIYHTDSPTMVKIKEFMALYGIIDIKMRMLLVEELKRIMGFPSDYVLIGTQADQKKFIGNAVEVTMARVLCQALAKELITLNIKPSKVAA